MRHALTLPLTLLALTAASTAAAAAAPAPAPSDDFSIGARAGLAAVIRTESPEDEGVLSMMSAEVDFRFDYGDWFGDITLGLMFDPSDDRHGALTLSGTGNLYLGEGTMAPYVGLGAGIRAASAPNHNGMATGFGGHAAAGVIFDRAAATHWSADLRVGAHFLTGQAGYASVDTVSYVRFELLAAIGATF